MKVRVGNDGMYDSGVHPEVVKMVFERSFVGEFFRDDRFPNLVELKVRCDPDQSLEVNCSSLITLDCEGNWVTQLKVKCPSLEELDCNHNLLTRLELNCPSLRVLWCNNNHLTRMELQCPSLQNLWCSNNELDTLELNYPNLQDLLCHNNRLTKLELDCPFLRKLLCLGNQLTDLNGLEYCSELRELRCSLALKESTDILKIHLPDLQIEYH